MRVFFTVTEYGAGGGPSQTRELDAPHLLHITAHLGGVPLRITPTLSGLLIECEQDGKVLAGGTKRGEGDALWVTCDTLIV